MVKIRESRISMIMVKNLEMFYARRQEGRGLVHSIDSDEPILIGVSTKVTQGQKGTVTNWNSKHQTYCSYFWEIFKEMVIHRILCAFAIFVAGKLLVLRNRYTGWVK